MDGHSVRVTPISLVSSRIGHVLWALAIPCCCCTYESPVASSRQMHSGGRLRTPRPEPEDDHDRAEHRAVNGWSAMAFPRGAARLAAKTPQAQGRTDTDPLFSGERGTWDGPTTEAASFASLTSLWDRVGSWHARHETTTRAATCRRFLRTRCRALPIELRRCASHGAAPHTAAAVHATRARAAHVACAPRAPIYTRPSFNWQSPECSSAAATAIARAITHTDTVA
jgi:hypothetical protein